jgi:hypothetical protein
VAWRVFAAMFHLGLLPSVWVLVRADEQLLGYLLPFGMSHVAGLWIVGRSFTIPLDRMAVQTLHKTGFLHTLLGLGAAVMTAAGAASTHAGVAALVAPLGAALLPHVTGVWLGHAIEMKRARVEAVAEDVGPKIDESAAAALRLLDQLQGQIKRFCGSVDECATACAETARRVADALGDLRTTARSNADAAGQFQLAVTALLEAVHPLSGVTDQTRIVLEQTIELLRTDLLKADRLGGRR